MLDCCPYINRDVDPNTLPFDIGCEKYVFSGGVLYKTLGDQNLYFYKIIDYILKNHKDMRFIFAGGGDATEITKIVQKYPARMFHIQERSDFIRLMENSVFFLITYPMFVGLMMRYSAMVGKVPLTLRHNSDHEGILKNQEELGIIEFDTYNDIIAAADRLINDSAYRSRLEEALRQAVVTKRSSQQISGQSQKEILKTILNGSKRSIHLIFGKKKKKYENNFNEINSELNSLSKDITMKKLNINDKKTNEVLENIKTTIIGFIDNLHKEVNNIKINNNNDYIKLTKQLEELKNEYENNLLTILMNFQKKIKKLQMK